ncbi:MAG TPA: hypothetical protein QGH10_27365, partial [Armatimonadota bacterium]|nr:hypothetical protein [Armatimonadota bacterium]
MRRQRRQMVVPGLVAALAGLCLPASRSQTPPADSFTIAAPTYDRGSGIVVVTSGYADPEPIIGSFGGVVEAEYDIDFPVTAEYTIQVRYAADAARPLQLSLDGERLGEVCRGTTGSWQSS